MGDTYDDKAQETPVNTNAVDRLFAVIRKTIKSQHSPHDPLTCNVCHNPIGREIKGICADESGQTVHINCYLQKVIASKSPIRH